MLTSFKKKNYLTYKFTYMQQSLSFTSEISKLPSAQNPSQLNKRQVENGKNDSLEEREKLILYYKSSTMNTDQSFFIFDVAG